MALTVSSATIFIDNGSKRNLTLSIISWRDDTKYGITHVHLTSSLHPVCRKYSLTASMKPLTALRVAEYKMAYGNA